MLYAIFGFLIFFLLAASGLLLVFYRETLGRRLAAIIGSTHDDVPRLSKTEQLNESVRTFAGKIQKAVPKGEKETSVVQQRLILAGFRERAHLNIFYASKILLPVFLCVLAAATGAYRWQPFMVLLAAIAAGYLAPDYWLGFRITARQMNINVGLPDALDLMVVCLEAGLSLDQAVIRTTDELASGHPAMAEELNLVMLEVRAGRNRVDAWKGLAARTDLDEVRILVTVFVQADQFGTGVSKTLRIHAETMRKRRSQRVEELAAKTSVKLVFPLVFCIFPSLFVVMLGPAILQISEMFKD
jgi:tight adherence protein C